MQGSAYKLNKYTTNTHYRLQYVCDVLYGDIIIGFDLIRQKQMNYAKNAPKKTMQFYLCVVMYLKTTYRKLLKFINLISILKYTTRYGNSTVHTECKENAVMI